MNTRDINEKGIGNNIENVTGLYTVTAGDICTPQGVDEIQNFIKDSSGKVSTGGGRYSMGGQIGSLGNSHIDMRGMNKVLNISPNEKEITVQSGITWREIIESIDPLNLSVMIMQTYANFTVGGSLSVNCHGRYIGAGPLVQSVKSIRIVNAEGELIEASPEKNSEIFYGAIGGYGLIGVIVDVTLKLKDNITLKREIQSMNIEEYEAYFSDQIRGNVGVILHNADISHDYRTVSVENWRKTSDEINTKTQLKETTESKVRSVFMGNLGKLPHGRKLRETLVHPFLRRGELICSRNHEATHDVGYLEPTNREKSTFVLQEYFVPVGKVADYTLKMQEILERHEANIINISIRNATEDPGTYLKWADGEVFSFVIYYRQDTDTASKREVGVWTRELTDEAIDAGGRYYLPYQIHHTPEQMEQAYPRTQDFLALKKEIDPKGKFSNTLGESMETAHSNVEAKILDSRFKTIFQNPEWRDKFYLFLQNIFSIAPTKDVYSLMYDIVEKYDTDEEIYRHILKEIHTVKPFLSDLRYGVPALKKQKEEMVNQTEELLSEILKGGDFVIDGYLEIGGFGRYMKPLEKKFQFTGKKYLLSDEELTNSPVNILERGGLRPVKNAKVLTYDITDFENIPNESLTMITIYIGLHHCPPDQLDVFNSELYKKLKPGGVLIVRDHDAHSPMMETMAGIAHDVFNVGTGVSGDVNFSEVRNFMSVEVMKNSVQKAGFEIGEGELLQDNDPTFNTLTYYQKPGATPYSEIPQKKNPNSLGIAGLSGYFYGNYKRGANSVSDKEKELTEYRVPNSEYIPEDSQRPSSHTFLTVPEWMIVYLSKDFGEALKTRSPSDFPYFQYIKDIWYSYGKMSKLTEEHPYNKEYHTMNKFIAFSTTLEFGIKGAYEKTVGKLFEKCFGNQTNEEKLYCDFANNYADFINTVPWYEYDFGSELKKLGKTKSNSGLKKIRSFERKASIGLELGLKAGLGKVIKKMTQPHAEAPKLETQVELEIDDIEALKNIKDVKIIEDIHTGKYCVSLPKYKLIRVLEAIQDVGYTFHNIAGNTDIMICIHADADQDLHDIYPQNSTLSFDGEEGVSRRRFVYVPVNELKNFYKQAMDADLEIEHVFDY